MSIYRCLIDKIYADQWSFLHLYPLGITQEILFLLNCFQLNQRKKNELEFGERREFVLKTENYFIGENFCIEINRVIFILWKITQTFRYHLEGKALF